MFSLLYGLWKYLFSKAEFHVLILGIDKAGKTVCLVTRWLSLSPTSCFCSISPLLSDLTCGAWSAFALLFTLFCVRAYRSALPCPHWIGKHDVVELKKRIRVHG